MEGERELIRLTSQRSSLRWLVLVVTLRALGLVVKAMVPPVFLKPPTAAAWLLERVSALIWESAGESKRSVAKVSRSHHQPHVQVCLSFCA